MPTTSGGLRASSTSACPKGAGFVLCPSAAIEAIIAEVVRRGLPDGADACRLHDLPPGIECCQRELPFVRLDADEVVLLALLEERHALAHQRVGDDHARLAARDADAAASKAATTASRSLPSTRCTNQPNASSLSTSGSKAITCVEGPSAC